MLSSMDNGTHSVDACNMAFSRALYAKKLVQEHFERQVLAMSPPCSEHTPTIDMENTEPKIGIIGAGMAGLYAALILDSLGLTNYEILEANPKRVGGRVFTQYFEASHDKFNGPSPAEKWNYIDYGAMRFPRIKIMDRVIGSQPWSLTNYLNSRTEGEDFKINLLEYHLSVDNNIQYYNSIRKTNAEVQREPVDPLHFGKSNGGCLDSKYVQTSYQTWLDRAFNSFKKLLKADFMKGFQALKEKDDFSVRAYLRQCKGPDGVYYPHELIDYLETLDSATGHYDKAFTEGVLDSFDFNTPSDDLGEPRAGGNNAVKWYCVEGGMSRFPCAMLSLIKSKPELGKRVSKIAPSSDDPMSKGINGINVFVTGEEKARTYDHVINTVPPVVLRSLDTTECNFSYDKRAALRLLCVDSSLKIGLRFKSRWWQDEKVMQGKPIKGGQSSTDLPIRTIVYPSYGTDDANAPGVLIASYAWGQDAARISALASTAAAGCEPSKVVELAMSNIALVHGVSLEFLNEQFVGQYHIQDWDRDENSQGAFALFGPGQFKTLYPGLIAEEMGRRYHTAGEMASPHHAWIVGALNSAWRCVWEILRVCGLYDKMEKLIEIWGVVQDV